MVEGRTQRVCVTGAGGYLGLELTARLLDRGHTVVALDRFVATESLEGIAALAHRHPGRVVEVHAGVGDAVALAAALPGVDAVVHLAAFSNDAACAADPVASARTNVTDGELLVEAMGEHRVPRLVFASTAAVYAGCGLEWVDETSVPAPLTDYGEQKLLAEQALAGAAVGTGTGVCSVRLASLWGSGHRPRFDLVVNRMVRDAVTTGRLVVHGDGAQRRPFLHVAAAADALARLATQQPDPPALLDLARADDALSMADLAVLVADSLQARPDVVHEGVGDTRTYALRCERAAALGLLPPTDWAAGLAELERLVMSGAVGSGRQPRYTAALHSGAPAHLGGVPVRTTPLPFATGLLGDEEEEAVVAAMRSGWLTAGPRARAFEEAIAARCGAPYGLAVTSCTAALHVALAALGVGPGVEVVTSPITFPATANVIRQLGATVVFADVDPTTLNLDPASLARVVTPATRAVVPVHMAGQPTDLTAVWEVAEAHGIPVVEDAAHALGATWQGVPVGGSPRSAAVCFSFYPTKNMTTMEGGAVVTHDPDLAARMRRLSAHGVSVDTWAREAAAGDAWPHWEVVEPGFKYLLPDAQAAVGLVQLGRFDGFVERRRAVAERYRAAFADVAGIEVLADTAGAVSAWHLFVLLVDEQVLGLTRDQLLLALKAEGIGPGVHFRSLTEQQAYAPAVGEADPSPRATAVGRRLLSIPLYPALTDDDVADVITAVRRIALYRPVDTTVDPAPLPSAAPGRPAAHNGRRHTPMPHGHDEIPTVRVTAP